MPPQDQKIDAMARWLNGARSRRGVLLGAAATALAAAPGLTDAAKSRDKPKRCPEGGKRCSGICVDTRTDPRNCGSCGHACDDDEICRNGACGAPRSGSRCTVCDDDDDCPFQSVQAAIDAAAPGDIVTICKGTYREDIVIANDVELRGVDLDDVTLEGSGQGAASVILVKREVTAAISGVTITGGTGTLDPTLQVLAGGGIFLENLASLTLANSLVAQNQAEVGAGIFCGNLSRLTLTDTLVTEQHAKAGRPNRQTFGGGIYARPGVDLQIGEGSFVSRNFADIGGGIYNQGVLGMAASALVGNEARLDGGGLLNDGGVAAFNDVLVGRNTASTRGGGIHVDGGRLDAGPGTTIEENEGGAGGGVNVSSGGKFFSTGAVIRKNDAKEDGGGIYSEGGEVVLTRTSVIDNDADKRGGGVFNGIGPLGNGTLTLAQSTIRGNKAGDTGGGIFNAPDASVAIDATSSVRRNKPNNCVGTAACMA